MQCNSPRAKAGNHEAIKAYFEALKTLGLEKDQAWIKSIFEARNSNGDSCFAWALNKAKSDTKDVLYQELRNLGFEEAWIQGLEKQV